MSKTQELINFLQGKKILIWGQGKEGKSTIEFLKRNQISNFEIVPDGENSDQFVFDNFQKFDLVFKSPGIPLKKIWQEKFNNEKLSEIENKITSQSQLFLEFFRDQTIGITGTKGKTTTSNLIFQVLTANLLSGNPSETHFTDDNSKIADLPIIRLVGNMGNPFFDNIDDGFNQTIEPIFVAEISSHQLEYAKSSPSYALITNLGDDHQDYYLSKKSYLDAKKNIKKFQKKEDFFADQTTIKEYLQNHPELKSIKTQLFGQHNLENIAFAKLIADQFKIPKNVFEKVVSEFQPLPNRLELVSEINSVRYINDSNATNPLSAIEGIKAINSSSHPISALLIGGSDKEIDYTDFIKFLNQESKKYKNMSIICLPQTGWAIYDQLKTSNKFLVSNFNAGFQLAQSLTLPNSSVLLSPAAASFTEFNNAGERGNFFKQLVANSDS